jgi:hypothetical protein
MSKLKELVTSLKPKNEVLTKNQYDMIQGLMKSLKPEDMVNFMGTIGTLAGSNADNDMPSMVKSFSNSFQEMRKAIIATAQRNKGV